MYYLRTSIIAKEQRLNIKTTTHFNDSGQQEKEKNRTAQIAGRILTLPGLDKKTTSKHSTLKR